MERSKSARAKKLDRIMTNIARFAVGETFTDEGDAQQALSDAIQALERAQSLLKEPEGQS